MEILNFHYFTYTTDKRNCDMKKKSTDNYVEGKKIKQMKNTIKHYDFSNKLSIRKIKKNVEI